MLAGGTKHESEAHQTAAASPGQTLEAALRRSQLSPAAPDSPARVVWIGRHGALGKHVDRDRA
jgi:hypothetical protein